MQPIDIQLRQFSGNFLIECQRLASYVQGFVRFTHYRCERMAGAGPRFIGSVFEPRACFGRLLVNLRQIHAIGGRQAGHVADGAVL